MDIVYSRSARGLSTYHSSVVHSINMVTLKNKVN